MEEWKMLDISNLKPDILTGDYEFEWHDEKCCRWWPLPGPIARVLLEIESGGSTVRYRKKEPAAPTHQEILSNWWLAVGHPVYYRVNAFKLTTGEYNIGSSWVRKKWFIGKESSDTPPEE